MFQTFFMKSSNLTTDRYHVFGLNHFCVHQVDWSGIPISAGLGSTQHSYCIESLVAYVGSQRTYGTWQVMWFNLGCKLVVGPLLNLLIPVHNEALDLSFGPTLLRFFFFVMPSGRAFRPEVLHLAALSPQMLGWVEAMKCPMSRMISEAKVTHVDNNTNGPMGMKWMNQWVWNGNRLSAASGPNCFKHHRSPGRPSATRWNPSGCSLTHHRCKCRDWEDHQT